MTNSSNYMNDFHYETILPQSADAYGSVTNFKSFTAITQGFPFCKNFAAKNTSGKSMTGLSTGL